MWFYGILQRKSGEYYADNIKGYKEFKNNAGSPSFLIPRRVSEKSYFTGSSGITLLNALVISMAVRMSACFLQVIFRLEHILYM